MCTLTYLLNEHGYELFFNRDEQRSRLLAKPPILNKVNGAIYPIDPVGGGTWIAVSKQGLSLALLNNYQAPFNNHHEIISRGQLILSLLKAEGDVIKQLNEMNLDIFQPFQLCIFPENLSIHHQSIDCVTWNGHQLIKTNVDAKDDLPITSSGINFVEVSEKRKFRFEHFIDKNEPLSVQFKDFHFSTEGNGKHSVNMEREDAKTVSISHISVNSKISKDSTLSGECDIRFEYFDNVVKKTHIVSTTQEKAPEIALLQS
jgi:hypothetical protein